MYAKVDIFNLALGALLLDKRIINVDSDTSSENKILKTYYDVAFRKALEDMDLDGTATQKPLELVEESPNDLWDFAYKYPTNCAFLRRIQSQALKDDKSTQITKRIAVHNGQKVVFTNQDQAIIEYIPNDLAPEILSASAGLAVAYKLAELSAALIAGKGALALKKDLKESYIIARADAQEQDRLENANFDDDEVTSEFVRARTS